MKSSKARGLLIFDESGEEFKGTIDEPFKMEKYKEDTNYDGLYRKAVNFLNSLDIAKAQNARLVFTNAKSNDATIVIYYPK